MRILYCNKYNHLFSGTEAYLFELMELMRARGHDVALFSMADARGQPTPYDCYSVPPIDFKSDAVWWQKVKTAGHAIYSLEAKRRIRAMIQAFQPDVAHVRNIYHHLSPSILWELKGQNVPVIYHVNDFQLLCPSYNLVDQGKSCEACKGGRFWHALAANCYPATSARVILMLESYVHRWLGTYRKCVDLFLAPSYFVRDKFVEHGWDLGKFVVLPHFQKIQPLPNSWPNDGCSVLYFGRLSAEKGIDDLLRAMQKIPQVRLVIAGEGLQREELQRLASSLGLSNVEFLGHVDGGRLRSLIHHSLFTVLPSRAYETFGKTILESFAEGRPVVASDLGSRRELVRHGETGLLYPPGDVDQLAKAIRQLSSKPELAKKMGEAGWEMVERNYQPDAHYQKLIALYEGLVRRKQNQQLVASQETWPYQSPAHDLGEHDGPATQKTHRLRIAFIGGRGVISKYSGIETYYEEVGRRLAEMGHEATIYCRTYFTPRQATHNGMRLVGLPTIRSKHLETLIHTSLSTMHALTQCYDVVHYHALGPALFSIFPRLLGTRTAVTVQGLDWKRRKWGALAAAVLRVGERASAWFPNATIVVSPTLQRHYRELYGIEVDYVPNGGILRNRRPPNEILRRGLQPQHYILFLGRFSPEKGCHLLVEAYERVNSDVPLVMAGGPSYCDEYCRELRKHACERIRICDWVCGEVLDELLTNAMLFVLPSDMEGLSLALLDAMGAGICVLTSDVPENRELVEGAGFTFRRGNVVDLENQLRFLIANPEARASAGQKARWRIEEQYQWQRIAEENEKIYFRLLGWELPPVLAREPNRLGKMTGT